MTVFWDAVPYSLVETDRHFKGAYSLHHQDDDNHRRSVYTGLHGAEYQKEPYTQATFSLNFCPVSSKMS
jgi:hypothetical protein